MEREFTIGNSHPLPHEVMNVCGLARIMDGVGISKIDVGTDIASDKVVGIVCDALRRIVAHKDCPVVAAPLPSNAIVFDPFWRAWLDQASGVAPIADPPAHPLKHARDSLGEVWVLCDFLKIDLLKILIDAEFAYTVKQAKSYEDLAAQQGFTEPITPERRNEMLKATAARLKKSEKLTPEDVLANFKDYAKAIA